MFAALPLLALPVILYNILAAVLGGFHAVDEAGRLGAPLFSVQTASHALWVVSLSDLLLTVALVVLFIELLKSAASHQAAIVNHSLSMVLFIICLVEFLLFPAFATSTFFLLMLMVVALLFKH